MQRFKSGVRDACRL